MSSWLWEDLGNYFGAGASALSFHENTYSLFFKPGALGSEAKIVKTEPSIARLELKNEVTTGPEDSGDQAWVFGSEFSFVQHVRGTIPAGVLEFSIKGMIPDPAVFCAELLESSLKQKGVVFHHQQKAPKEKKIFHITSSPSVEEIVYVTNQKSINLYAEHLLKQIGVQTSGEGTCASGLSGLKAFLEKKGVPTSGMLLSDGSGLSQKNLLTARQLTTFLRAMKSSEHFSVFYDSLGEVKPGVKGKSGFNGLNFAFAGYKGEIAFAIIINHALDTKASKEKIDSCQMGSARMRVTSHR